MQSSQAIVDLLSQLRHATGAVCEYLAQEDEMGREHYQARNKHLFHLEAVEASYIKLVNGLLRETLHASIVLLRDGLIVAPVPTEILLVRLLTRSRGVTVLVGPPDTGGLLSMVQALQYYLFTAHAPGILDLSCFPFFFFFFNEQPPD